MRVRVRARVRRRRRRIAMAMVMMVVVRWVGISLGSGNGTGRDGMGLLDLMVCLELMSERVRFDSRCGRKLWVVCSFVRWMGFFQSTGRIGVN